MSHAENIDKDITIIEYKDKKIIIVGTAHVSLKSAELVKETIKNEMPDTVAIELCQERYEALSDKNRWQNMDIVKVIKEKKVALLLVNMILSAFQKKIAKKLNVTPGLEMIEAIDSAKKIDAKIELIDRNVKTTLKRAWRLTKFKDKIKALFSFIFSKDEVDKIEEENIESMKDDVNLKEMMSEIQKKLPSLKKVLVDERDIYLSYKLKNAPGNKIVAVVGAGHVPGICKTINSDYNIDDLEKEPPSSKSTKVIKWIIPLLIVGLIIFGFFQGGVDKTYDMLFWWVAANSVFAALGALIVLSHPITILSAFLFAPITSLNPMIAAGWVAGLVETFVRKPKVKDFENLADDILSVKGFFKNKVTRILLIVIFTNIGSALGTFVAIPLMLK